MPNSPPPPPETTHRANDIQMCDSFSLAATSLLIQGKRWSCVGVVRGVNVEEYRHLCQMTSRFLSGLRCRLTERSEAQLIPPACLQSSGCCVVIHTYLMTPDSHSEANASVVIGVTCVGSIMHLYLYLSCQLLITFSLWTSLLIWHTVSSSLLIIFKQIWEDKNQFPIILEDFFFFSIHPALWRGLQRLDMHDWEDPEPCRVNNHLMWV